MVNMLSQQNVAEGTECLITCTVTPGNPSSSTFNWTKVDDQGFEQYGPTLQLPNIKRTSAGTYTCTAQNNYSNGDKGMHSQSMVVNVQCKSNMIYIKLIIICVPKTFSGLHIVYIIVQMKFCYIIFS